MLSKTDVEAVIIATPTERHHADVMTALKYRKTVLVEKPITATMKEADEVTRRGSRNVRCLLAIRGDISMRRWRGTSSRVAASAG